MNTVEARMVSDHSLRTPPSAVGILLGINNVRGLNNRSIWLGCRAASVVVSVGKLGTTPEATKCAAIAACFAFFLSRDSGNTKSTKRRFTNEHVAAM